MEYWLAWFHETKDGAEVKAIAESAEELKALLGSLDELSDNQAAMYVIAVNPFSDEYLHEMESLGIDGVVLMSWANSEQTLVSFDKKLKALR